MKAVRFIPLVAMGAVILPSLFGAVLEAHADETPTAPASTPVATQTNMASGSLEVPAISDLNFSQLSPGGNSTISLNNYTISDQRSPSEGWALTVSMSDLTDGDGHTITADHLSYTAGQATWTNGTGVVSSVTSFASTGTIASLTPADTSQSNSMTLSGEFKVTIPDNAIRGSYSGTLTLSAS